MASTIWVISDTHFFHTNFLSFKGLDDQLIRPFSSTEEMNEHMIEKWNSVVRPQDHVYHLGDFMVAPRESNSRRKGFLAMLFARLNGRGRLVRGNHDIEPTRSYLPYFEEIHGVRVLEGLIMTHIPIHPSSLGRAKANVHGHIHERVVMTDGDPDCPPYTDSRYVNVSVERINYTPVSLDQLKEQL